MGASGRTNDLHIHGFETRLCIIWRDRRTHGGGFGGPDWSVRISLANLAENTYPKIGEYLREAAQGYVEEWQATKKK